ncbi:type III toxin-antitoxin system ToxN/AbiQ family toxin [Rheinheimera riviphila]|uniref:Type III toxin-antitoxin system ToxN/AbiQ family toxin n=1 Tax=Rheinheimera riviphila TaxID=1834037 RepID=A0A437QFF0_9GAMM|nr:type III toxin-antitoxin system ToxN/AbiQ family toxin [Rheinheimera riviphila]RVU33242.1 type III toxin-antitoxin system ToxN/AbiQ family toxin [Rheinheimera riviphila]
MKSGFAALKAKKVAIATFFISEKELMKFYTISDDYISYLLNFDHKVPNNGGAGYKGKKVYIGIVLEIGTHKFLAPLTSYKPAQDRIQSSSCSAFKLHERTNPDNKLGLIALNYMIPVLDSELVEFDIEAQEHRYKQMLHRQYEFIKANRQEIIERASKLYEHVVIKRTEFFVRISCDIPKLVDEYRNYEKPKEQDN